VLRVRRLTPVLVAVLPFFGGCSGIPSLVAVEGVVTIGGNPAANLLIQFTPKNWTTDSPIISSHAVSDANGRFVLMSTTNKPGAILGTHKVTVVDNALGTEDEPGDSKPKNRPRNRIPLIYNSTTTTPIELAVEAGKKEYEVQVAGIR